MKERKLLKEGPATFYVKWASKTDKSGNIYKTKAGDDKIVVVLYVTDSAGQSEEVFVNFTCKWLQYLTPLINSLGIPNNYTAEMIFNNPETMDGSYGLCVLAHEEYLGVKQNKIAMFSRKLVGPELMAHSPAVAPGMNEFRDDEIPF